MLSEKMLPVSGAEFFGRIACRDRLFLFWTDLAAEDGKMGVGFRRWMKEGADGNDTYIFNKGDGSDTIRDYEMSSTSGKSDRIIFGEGINPDDVRLERVENDLVIRYTEKDSVTVKDAYYYGDGRSFVENIEFADGTKYDSRKINDLAKANDMDNNLAYMWKMVQESEGRMVFNKEKLAEYGARVKLFDGVEDWFERIRAYGKTRNVIVEHYIISSGLKEMIEGTKMARAGAFEKIYASSFYFNDRGVAKWPAQVINYTSKTQFLFRIEKGVLDINDPGVNAYFSPEEIRVPFRNMVYIGDSDTDIPCMKLVNTYGGHSIGVYDPATQNKKKVYKMMHDKRIRYYAPAD